MTTEKNEIRGNCFGRYRQLFWRLCSFVFLNTAMLLANPGLAAEQPNIIFVLADDLGWADLGCYGSTFYETPHLDQLAEVGMRFTNAYAASPVCSPTRASILTGKYPARLQLTEWIPGVFYPHEKLLPGKHHLRLPLQEVTIAESLREAGYVTGLIGKWHLGRQEQYHPSRQGFDTVVNGTPGGPYSYFSPYRNPSLADGPIGENLTDRHTQEAIKFIEQNKSRPFFLYLAYNAVHTTKQSQNRVEGKSEYEKKYRAKLKKDVTQKNASYAAMVQSLDDGVGRLVATLQALELDEQTLVIFFSDNGGYSRYTNNAPLRGGKGVLYEGGIREPLIVCWPGSVPPNTTCDEPITSVDFFPTLLEVAGMEGNLPHNRDLDGVSLVSMWKNAGTKLPREAIFWHYPHYYKSLQSRPHSAIRSGPWKLIENYEDDRIELFNLENDIGEEFDLSAQLPNLANQLREKLHAWQINVNAQMPVANPDYDPDPSKRYQGKK